MWTTCKISGSSKKLFLGPESGFLLLSGAVELKEYLHLPAKNPAFISDLVDERYAVNALDPVGVEG